MANKSKVQSPKSNKPRRSQAKAGERACLRCGCTEDRACAGGCCWVAGSNVCDACLSPAENDLLDELCEEFSKATTTIEEKRAKNRIATFGRYLNETSYDMPIPYVPVKGGGK